MGAISPIDWLTEGWLDTVPRSQPAGSSFVCKNLRGALTALMLTLLAFASMAASAASNGQMRAVRMHAYGGPEVLKVDEVPIPEPAAGQVRVRVRAVGINPFDWKLREGRMKAIRELPLPHIPGTDVSGVIDKLGPGVEPWKVGDEVIAALHRAPQGGYAQYTLVPVSDMVLKPQRISFEQAAGVPTTATTAWRFLIDIAKLQAGQRVFIHGGAGGVGSAAVQIAKARGAYVMATASAKNHDYLHSLGADETIDYHTQSFDKQLRSADVVLDTVGSDTLQQTPALMRAGATLVSTAGAASAQDCERAHINCPAGGPPRNPEFGRWLGEITRLIEAGQFSIHVDRTFCLEQAGDAQALSQQGHTRGKLVLRVDAACAPLP